MESIAKKPEVGQKRLSIAVCDDEPVQAEYLCRLAETWADERQVRISVRPFHKPEAFLFEFEADQDIDLLLLDIIMPRMNGMALAEKLRAKGASLQIAFITATTDFIARGYDVDALHYLVKPVDKVKLFAVLDKALTRHDNAPCMVLLPISGEMTRVRADEIVSAEAFSHYVELRMRTRSLLLKLSMNELETLLGDGFFRCHRSYIAGLRYVRQVSRRALLMDSGEELPLSRRLYDEANQVFIKFNRS